MRRLVEHRRNFGSKAPITEALVDIRVVNPDGLDLQALKDFAKPFADRFPTSRLQTQFESQVKLGDGGPSVGFQHGLLGFSFFSPNKDRVVQARRDGFTFSKLQPYESWEKLREEGKELWERYREVANPRSVTRLAVRYINLIRLPQRPIELQELFNLHPTAPRELPPMEEFLIRTVWRHPDNPAYTAIATQATQPAGPDGRSSIVLDIDVFVMTDDSLTEAGIWEVLDDLRDFKNDIFFGTITQTTEQSLL